MVDISSIFNFLINGTVDGAYYSLIAIGFSLVYGVGGILNLSHGGFYILTGYLIVLFIPLFIGFEFLSVFPVLIIVVIIGALAYWFLIKPMEETPTGVLLVTFGIGYLIQELMKVKFSNNAETIPQLQIPGNFDITSTIQISYHSILIIVASVIILLIFALMIKKTKFGNSVRAVSQDKEAASLMGINSKAILLSTVVIAIFLAAIAAVLYLPIDTIEPRDGFRTLTSALTIVILGGMGSLVGSVIGAYIIGYATIFTTTFVPNGAALSSLIPLIIIIIILLIKPNGLFGKKEIE